MILLSVYGLYAQNKDQKEQEKIPVAQDKKTVVPEKKQNPYKAMLLSAVLPGGGQVYNHAYVKAVVVIGVQAYFVNSAIGNYNKMEHYRSIMNDGSTLENALNRQQRDNYRNDLKSDYWWIGTTLFLSVADAFVDAHLYNFKAEKEKVHLKFNNQQLQLEYKF
jgi:hypothetical protein